MNAVVPTVNDQQKQSPPPPSRLARSFIRFSHTIAILAILLIFTELFSAAILSVQQGAEDAGQTHSYYRDKPWATEYFKEFEAALHFQYRPYVLWRHKAFAGKYINVDENGIRRTINPNCSPGATQIWMFGASTLWGVGAPDEQTIPSILSKEYSRSIGAVCVTNFAEPAWVSNQNVVQLEIALKHASRSPDIVLFYDGLADIIGTYQNGNADGHFGLSKIRDRVESVRNRTSTFGYLKESATWRLVELSMRQVGVWDASGTPVAKPSRSLSKLATMTVENYRANLRLVDALSTEYGFRYISFWEPMILSGNKPLSDPERQMLAEINQTLPGLADLSRETYELMFSSDNPHVVNIADTFDHTERDTYMAVGHIDPEGNRQVALRILEVLKRSGKEQASLR